MRLQSFFLLSLSAFFLTACMQRNDALTQAVPQGGAKFQTSSEACPSMCTARGLNYQKFIGTSIGDCFCEPH
ncbi:hypothetical protein COW36_11155 [bacterium (Candidatus Blackallbacteria) CG17_big_fil_post_rev_8_21_14_2_50_48_46]|uniref:Lipoprotein n=1 Tax=bacterium (Candidatus Blackallbacteria) CG17_big_fil_post_rev_8_21_14_2_50_48_46 TaxID=2014261 RepID=A0A2M7G4J1_9BACT|nr:MAG: hypothetical protein COW64_18250 [bacterium (Candidatus Blackallbacteria) CG18_big_fil_WC_8_21_14_2_50_49_26]PIW16832.1 MAG: hypothetical protein COW36_11155 [bacterium (Candidatus Blackallbacteria) CG17_big_fil_post_rev_8_21_14_2_50_48_46]PIW48029.1 MAG: hypothetical protein COW20_10870 [bacterium (Candidatus Blackallbacteria) CG13_big_fil_rev_8_21_14_2_50_49_14]